MEDSKYIVLLEKLSEIGERTARIEAKQESVDRRLSSMEEQDHTQNRLLAEHIEGTVQNREAIKYLNTRKDQMKEAHDSLKSRVELLEKPATAFQFFKENILWVSAVIGGIAAFLMLFAPHK